MSDCSFKRQSSHDDSDTENVLSLISFTVKLQFVLLSLRQFIITKNKVSSFIVSSQHQFSGHYTVSNNQLTETQSQIMSPLLEWLHLS